MLCFLEDIISKQLDPGFSEIRDRILSESGPLEDGLQPVRQGRPLLPSGQRSSYVDKVVSPGFPRHSVLVCSMFRFSTIVWI
jgi:hypothetical protein